MMLRFCQRCRIGFGREQIEATINLKCIRVDDFGADLRGNVSRDLRFASCGWADDEKDVLQICHSERSRGTCYYFRNIERCLDVARHDKSETRIPPNKENRETR